MNEDSSDIKIDFNGNLRFDKSNLHKTKNNLNADLNEEIRENLIGIFVVSFDTRQGNVIEWQIPENLNLEHVEFKAMASGLHLVKKDLV